MECVLSGNQIKCLNRTLMCFAKIGNELLIEAVPDKLIFRTLNSSRSSFLSVRFKVEFFDAYHVSDGRAQCGVLLKSACTVFRTSPGNMDRLSISLAEQGASKLLWTLDCPNGVRKTYGICCHSNDALEDVAVDKSTMPSHLVVRPRDLTRLLGHFQSSLQEITFILTEPISTPTDSETTEAKAVEMRSFIDPATAGTETTALHTQLWIDPTEELLEYSHSGLAADVTFSVKELKAFVAFCEGSEVDLHMYCQKAGYPVLLAPKFGLDDSAHADFDATLILATCHSSQIRSAETFEHVGSRQSAGRDGRSGQNNSQNAAQQRNPGSRASTPASFRDSERTVIWSELSGSAERVSENQSRARRESVGQANSLDASEEIPVRFQRQNKKAPSRNSTPGSRVVPLETTIRSTPASHNRVPSRPAPVQSGTSTHETPTPSASLQAPPAETRPMTQDHAAILAKNLRNWVSGDMEDDDDEDTAEEEFCVESTPPDRRGLY